MGRAIERCAPRADMIVARITCEILGPIPVGELEVPARITRGGRSVELVEAVARADGRDVARATAWRVLRASSEPVGHGASAGHGGHGAVQATVPGLPGEPAPGQPGEPSAQPKDAPPGGWGGGYLSAVEWRAVRGSFAVPGPATVWARLRYPLVPDEEVTALERVLALADSASGISYELDFARWRFINPELSVHLHREPSGEWICLDAVTTISAGGAGLATSALYDLDGPVGVSAQALLVAPRAATSTADQG
jgi:hypothetical protein